MNYRTVLTCIICLALFVPLMAGTPVIDPHTTSPSAQQVRMMDYLRLYVSAKDDVEPGIPLVYEWTITQDPTAKAYFTSNSKTIFTGGGGAELAFPWISNSDAVNSPFVGQTVQIVVIVKHENIADGPETASHTFNITLSGINHPPVPAINGTLGTPTNRIPSGSAVVASSGGSSDPDPNDTYRSDWALGGATGGMLLGGIAVVGSEGSTMSFTVPNMVGNVDQPIILQLTDGMHQVRTTVTAYLKPAGDVQPPPVGGNTAPVVTVDTPVNKLVNETVILTGTVTDANGDDCLFSWVWLQNGATVAQSAITATPVAVTSGRKWNVSANLGPAPAPGSFQFRLTAKERSTTGQLSGAAVGLLNVTQGGTNLPPDPPIKLPGNCAADNPPPTVGISPNPELSLLKYQAGQQVSITVTAQDSSQEVTALGVTTGASIEWDLSQLGVFASAPGYQVNPTDKTVSTSTLTFTAPNVSSTGHITVTAVDKKGCQMAVKFSITFEGQQTNNQAPVAKIRYKVGSAAYQNAPATAVSVDSPATITLDATTSTDDGGAANLTYLWTKTDNITAGGVTLASASTNTATLTINSATTGSVTLTLKATDQQGANGTATVSFTITNSAAKPTAKVTVKLGSAVVAGAVEEGSVVTLDGTGSTASDGSKTHLSYSWRQTAGSSVGLTGADTATATFTAPSVSADGSSFKFELSVTDTQTNGTAKQEGTVLVNIPATYFAQIGVGPLGSDELRTVLLLVNSTSQAARGIVLDFFDSEGQPLDAVIDGKPWTKEPFDIQGQSSKRMEFSGTPGAATKQGWAKVKSNVKLTGLVLFQIVNSAENDVQREISLFSSSRGRNFATYFNPSEETALAVANPGDQAVTINVKLIDYVNGEQWIVKNSVLFPEIPGSKLAAKQHRAKFVDANLLGQLPTNFKEGTLIIESDGEIIVTVLKTKEGVAFSALPLAYAK